MNKNQLITLLTGSILILIIGIIGFPTESQYIYGVGHVITVHYSISICSFIATIIAMLAFFFYFKKKD